MGLGRPVDWETVQSVNHYLWTIGEGDEEELVFGRWHPEAEPVEIDLPEPEQPPPAPPLDTPEPEDVSADSKCSPDKATEQPPRRPGTLPVHPGVQAAIDRGDPRLIWRQN